MSRKSIFERLGTFAIFAGLVTALASPPAIAKGNGKSYRQHKRACLREDPNLKSKALQACIKRKTQAIATNQAGIEEESKIISD
jgi:hypothetical protein